MPRDGLSQYAPPPGTNGITNYTIESTKYNGFVADVTQDLNLPRPIVAGGTGASNARDALTNLSGEMEGQIVTNYDSDVFVSGSFYSATTATNPPVAGHAFVGICYSSDPLPTPPAAPLNQNLVIEARDQNDTTVPGLRYIREKKAGVWSLWKVDVGSTAVRYDAPQGLTTAQQVQARQNIYAAPFDALAYSGMQINGSMDVAQELGNNGRLSSGYIADVFYFQNTSTVAITAGRGIASPMPGIPNFIYLSVTGSPGAPAASDIVRFIQNIEGYRVARLGWGTASAQAITIAFWCQNWRAGTYSVQVQNFDGSRSYATTYTQNVSNAVEYKTVTIPGDTAGTWKTDNSTGLTINFTLAAGATLTAPAANTWYGTTYIAAPGQVNGIASTSDFFRITGVVVLPGIEAPSAARSPLIMRPYDQELLTCQRYYIKSYPYAQPPGTVKTAGTGAIFIAGAAANTYCSGSITFPVRMRAPPTVTTYSNTGVSGSSSYYTTIWNNGGTLIQASNDSELTRGFIAPTSGIASMYNFDFVADARL